MVKSSDVYLRAAEIVEFGHPTWVGTEFSCIAIAVAQADLRGSYDEGSEAVKYAEIFKPEEDKYAWGDLFSADPDERQDCRILALLFMHEIAKDEEKQ